MTVSKVLRDAPDISVATKARVRKLAAEMGYVPDSMAQGLRNRKTKFFGLVVSAVSNPMVARTIMAIEEGAYQLGYEVVLAQTLNQTEREDQVLRRLLSRRVDGIFIIPVYRHSPSAPIYDEIKKRAVPTVILGHKAPFCSQFPNVEGDDVRASYSATRHLIDLGHRRIAYLSGIGVSPSAHDRFEGYRRALRDAQIEEDESLIFNAGNTIEEGEKAALQMLNEMPNATAIQAFNDLVAIGAASTFLKQGFKIPHDLSIVGFGNILLSEFFSVPLTTIRQAKYRLGTAALEMMQKLLQGMTVESRSLPAELIIRESTSHPRESINQAGTVSGS